jgi:hypothetical protein
MTLWALVAENAYHPTTLVPSFSDAVNSKAVSPVVATV